MARRLTTSAPVAAAAAVAAKVGVAAGHWEDAVRAAAQLLVNEGAVDERYPQRCIDIVHQQGPYIVVAPGIALAHARSEDGTRFAGLTAVVLSAPVAFGHPVNDPVDVVFAFASPDARAHVALLAGLAKSLVECDLAARLRAAASDDEAVAILREVESYEEQ